MTKRKEQDKQHNDQKKMTEGQATPWPTEKGQKNKQHNDKKKRTEGQVCVACPSVPVLLTIVLLVLLSLFFGHCVACPSVTFLLAIVLLEKGQKDKQHNDQK
jgi:hypothetical protein